MLSASHIWREIDLGETEATIFGGLQGKRGLGSGAARVACGEGRGGRNRPGVRRRTSGDGTRRVGGLLVRWVTR